MMALLESRLSPIMFHGVPVGPHRALLSLLSMARPCTRMCNTVGGAAGCTSCGIMLCLAAASPR